MTEINLEGEGEELFVPLSELGGKEPDEPDGSRAPTCKLYNDYPVGITILRRAGGKYRYLFTLDSGATSDDFWTDDELWIASNTGFKYRVEFQSGGGHRFFAMHKVSPAAGTNNVSRL
ncbi:hypothetical protein ACFXPS_42270 [Nocardia sp. NPDC059091]|uniref:hypothetical protein n=1 Tax=unclassified Nocardia TaxID=2637762 RepID=UPI0036826EF2